MKMEDLSWLNKQNQWKHKLKRGNEERRDEVSCEGERSRMERMGEAMLLGDNAKMSDGGFTTWVDTQDKT